MPYGSVRELPPGVKKLPKHGQEIYMAAFNAALKLYDNEGKAHATAWAAAEKKYHKKDGRWVSKEAVHAHGDHICVCPKCDTEITVAENVKCNTQDCPECGVRMRAKDIGERRETKEATMADMSDENKRAMLQTALSASYFMPQPEARPGNIWIEDVFESELVYNIDGQSYKVSYKIEEDKATFGEPEKVVRQTVYEPMEALRRAYAEYVQESGKRNATRDAATIKRIRDLCEDLLSSEEKDDDKFAKAKKEVEEATAKVKQEAVTKTEEGAAYPASAFAYAPEADKPSGWKLRMWEDLDSKVTKRQLGAAAAALSPGGFRGQKVQIPAEALSAVKRKIRAAYRALDVDDEDIPRWVKETMTREQVSVYTPLTEAKFDKGRAHVVVIKAGFNSGKDRFYPADMLARDCKVFEGVKMYADHPSEFDEKNRPERSIRDWVATLTEVKCDDNGTVTGIATIIEPWLQEKLANLRDKQLLSEMGISIDAIGNASKAKVDGVETLVVETLVRARSVDFVTEPGAGGVVTLYEADRGQDVDLIELGALRERRPDLVLAIEADSKVKFQQEAQKIMDYEKEIQEKDEQIAALTTERDDLQTKAQEAEKQAKVAETKAAVEKAVGEADLPEAAKKRVLASYAEAVSSDGLEDAIKAESDYVAAIRDSGKVKGLGESKGPTDAGKAALRESFKKSNPEWTDAQIETAVNGR